jgi:putative ABC transport system permease protein
MFGLIQGVLLSPPPFREPDRLVLVDAGPRRRTALRPRRLGRPVAGLAQRPQPRAGRALSLDLQLPRPRRRQPSLGGMVVTRDFFDVVGVRPLLGRTFTATEASQPGKPASRRAPSAILLGYDLWQREFGGDPASSARPSP